MTRECRGSFALRKPQGIFWVQQERADVVNRELIEFLNQGITRAAANSS
jgi:uncharacterized protein YigE (DUF2233 family)